MVSKNFDLKNSMFRTTEQRTLFKISYLKEHS